LPPDQSTLRAPFRRGDGCIDENRSHRRRHDHLVRYPQRREAGGAANPREVKANQPTRRAGIESLFATARPESLAIAADLDNGHGRIGERTVTVASEAARANGVFQANSVG
jgi:hypothetical protein